MPLTKPKIVEKLVNVNNARVFSFSGDGAKTKTFNIGDFIPKEVHLYAHSWGNNNAYLGACWKYSTGGTTTEGIAIESGSIKTKSLKVTIADNTIQILTATAMNGSYKLILFAKEND